jgi:proteasome-associated ATPase
VASLREEVEKLTQPPSAYGVVLGTNDDGSVDVLTNSRKMRVSLHPDIDVHTLERGSEVVLNESLNVVLARGAESTGEVVSLKEVLDDGIRAIVTGRGDDDRVCELADALRGMHLRSGDLLRLDTRSGLLLERLAQPEVEHLLLEEVPDISYDDIGGLDKQIEAIADAVELPFLHGDLFAEHHLPAPKGILLYGPPGCGKTLIAKAVANSLARKVAARTGADKGRSYFINIKGPELLNKYVGETERQIRMVFQRAREKSEEGWPVIVFFDEMDSMFRTRGTGISSDMESTIVPQLLAEIDGVEGLRNVIVIGATNREDLIDPAILRPGRLDVKIRIERPDAVAARQIFARYLTTEVPIAASEVERHVSAEATVASMIDATVAAMYAATDDNRFLEVTYQNGEREILYFRDFASGAMIENIVRRAKKLAIKRLLAGGERGVATDDLIASIRQEFNEHEDLPNTTNPDDWAKVSGRKGERIVFIRTLTREQGAGGGKAIERTATGQYL